MPHLVSRLRRTILIAPLAACTVMSETPLMDPATALPLAPGLDASVTILVEDEPPAPLTFRAMPDGITLLVIDPNAPTDRPREDIAASFHPMPGRDDILVAQYFTLRDGEAHSDERGYQPISCGADDRLIVHGFDTAAVLSDTPVDGLGVRPGYEFTYRATSAEAVHALFQAGLAHPSADSIDFGPGLTCALLFGTAP